MFIRLSLTILSLLLLSLPAHAQDYNPYGADGYNSPVHIAVLGDGLYSGFGLFQSDESYVARLEERVVAERFAKKAKVHNHTNEGLSTATAYQYIPTILQEKTDIVILGLGYNDALSGYDIDTMHNHMDTILTELYRRRVYVMLFQPTLPQDVEHHYVSRFNDMFAKLIARYNNVVPVTEFMKDVVKNPYALDNDTRYPTELGATIMLDNTSAKIAEAVQKIRRMRIELDD